MSMWLYQFFFSPQAVAWQLGLFGVVVALAMPTVALTRIVALIAAVVGIAVAAAYAGDPVGVFWWSVLAIVIVVRMAVSRGRGFGGHLNAEEQLFHDKVVPGLSASQVRQLLAVGRWRDVVAGTTLTRGGQPVSELVLRHPRPGRYRRRRQARRRMRPRRAGRRGRHFHRRTGDRHGDLRHAGALSRLRGEAALSPARQPCPAAGCHRARRRAEPAREAQPVEHGCRPFGHRASGIGGRSLKNRLLAAFQPCC